MFHFSQDNDYLRTCVNRVKNEYLTWCEQVNDILQSEFKNKSFSLNDIGCNCGQLLKSILRRKLKCQYRGYDIEEIYLKEARKLFQRHHNSFEALDIVAQKPTKADVSVSSATIEHLEYLRPGLDNILSTTNQIVIIRTFLGDNSLKAIRLKPKAKRYYYINQYSFCEFMDILNHYGFDPEIIRDRFTDSMPKYLTQGIVRTQYMVLGRKN